MQSSLTKRLTTGLLGAAVFLAFLFVPLQGVFALGIGLLMSAGIWEWATFAGAWRRLSRLLLVLAALVVYAVALNFYALYEGLVEAWMGLAVLLWVLTSMLLFQPRLLRGLMQNTWLVGSLGLFFLVTTGFGLVWLKHLPGGEWMVVLLVGLVAMADTAAFFTGRFFGRNKLAQDISPSKTREGAIGGLAGNLVLVALILGISRTWGIEALLIFVLIIVSSIFAVFGDLIESALKRHSGVKDSGAWLPGHGGLLDRIDGLMAATPFFVFFLIYSGAFA